MMLDIFTRVGVFVPENKVDLVRSAALVGTKHNDVRRCVAELIGNPLFKDQIAFAPERVYTSAACTDRRYDETWTGDWWWNTQVRIYGLNICGG